uniref:NADH-ubiquinone oxidoreductase chain 3 n=1 Tax=Mordellochroa milleri TaxID=1588259 RepID=A0A343C1P8_9CUCU|nr:NADH dehydrogenase subunit 3 [Mordellochroa milleri]
MLTTSFIIISSICSLMVILVNLISKKSFSDREKSSPFECGFDPKSLARMPFSLQFFLVAVIFLIFDVEITLLLPMLISLKYTNIMQFYFLLTMFILILLFGLYHEWNQNALEWSS